MKKHLLVTGGAGFIGSNFVHLAVAHGYQVTILDALTYAGHEANIRDCIASGKCQLIRGRIEDAEFVNSLFAQNKFSSIVHFAAESHVDNSITGPEAFVQTNVLGTFVLLQAARAMFTKLSDSERVGFRFVHVSTDEVFGSLGENGYFTEDTAYAPNSPYSASKAASDHLARAWFHTYSLPTIITNCSNNYGPRQFPEKLIPRMITLALRGEKLPVYGKGMNVRDWIHVEDHCAGVLLALENGEAGGSYCFGGNSERRNIDVVTKICEHLDKLRPQESEYSKLISFVEDRLGHDYRYAIDDRKAIRELGFKRQYSSFEDGLLQTMQWYLENDEWLREIEKRKKI